MFIWFLVLAAISLCCLIGGTAWMLVTQGQTTRRQGPETGAEIMGGELGDSDSTGGTIFRGQGVAVKREVSVSIVDLKAAWLAGQRRAVLPFVIAIGGFVATLIFGGLALVVGLEEKIWGLFLLATGLYTVWLLLKELRKPKPD